ncbi:MAG: YesL family protein [Lachnospiraceae bacterium]|nr:YesL family protein [Lachnospiraceae bacterium]
MGDIRSRAESARRLEEKERKAVFDRPEANTQSEVIGRTEANVQSEGTGQAEESDQKVGVLESDPDLDMHVRDLDRPDPEKKDLKSRIMRLTESFGDFFFLNLMFIVGCLPLVTIGTSFCALHTVMQKRIRNEDGTIVKDFKIAYKANLKQGILVWLLSLLYVGICLVGIFYCVNTSGTLSNVIMCVDGIFLILFVFVFPFLFPLIARYENSTVNVIKNALILSLSEFPTWFMMVFPWAAVIVLYVFVPNAFLMTWYLWCMILVSVIVYSEAILMKKVFDKLEAKTEKQEGEQNS